MHKLLENLKLTVLIYNMVIILISTYNLSILSIFRINLVMKIFCYLNMRW